MVADGESTSSFCAATAPAYDVALDVLGDWGSDRDWLANLPPPPASPVAVSEPRDDAPKRRDLADTRTHYRRKRESRDAKRTALEQQVNQLAQTLEMEKQRLPARDTPLTGDALALSREWSNMATRQRRQRRASEQQHTALRDRYDAHVKLADQIDRLLQKALRIGHCLQAPTRETVAIAAYSGPTLGISSHVAYLDRLLAQAHCVTASGVFAQRSGREFREVCVRNVAEEGIQVDFVAEFVLPFSVTNVAEAIWAESTHMEHAGREVDHEHALWNSCVLVSSFVSGPDALDVPGSNHGQVIAGTTHGQAAVRRFDPARDGSIWLVSMNHARILDKDGKPSGFLNGDGWIRVEPVRKRPGGSPSRDVCRVKWCHQMRGRPIGHETASRDERARWAYGAVTGRMRTQWEQTFETALQTIENALVDAAAADRTSDSKSS